MEALQKGQDRDKRPAPQDCKVICLPCMWLLAVRLSGVAQMWVGVAEVRKRRGKVNYKVFERRVANQD